MASGSQLEARPTLPGDVWPPDDTEESILGTDLHQGTITNLRFGINEAARLGLPPGQPVPWQALNQIALLGCVRPDGSAYRTSPDLFVYPRPITPVRGSLLVEVDGPPVLVSGPPRPAPHPPADESGPGSRQNHGRGPTGRPTRSSASEPPTRRH